MKTESIRKIEDKWLARWENEKHYSVELDTSLPKYYCLDMFPYPSGAGLHVGHPRGYIATDVYSRFKRMAGFNVLHPMGFDSFGLPAEQYAIETGQHPRVTTDKNIATFKSQLRKLGFCYDPDREIKTSDAQYYHWTQWIFSQLFDSWFCLDTHQAQPVDTLIQRFEQSGNAGVNAWSDSRTTTISAQQWAAFSPLQQSEFLMNYRLAYRADSYVNWCPALGTVLANDEIKDGFSERGGHPVQKKMMKQWMLRISAYADRLLEGLDSLDWPEALKDMQRNWIGKSQGAEIDFQVRDSQTAIKVFTTRPDTLYGATFLVLAPEHDAVEAITSAPLKLAVANYREEAALRSERERMAKAERITGQFTGAYAVHPLTGENLPIWIADYVLADYGTGAIMAVPSGDQRDFNFAQAFDLPVVHIYEGAEQAAKPFLINEGRLINSQEATGMLRAEATEWILQRLVATGTAKRTFNYRIRDAIFGRQRYWGEPIPVYYDEQGIARVVPEQDLPVTLPDIEAFLPTSEGEPPLERASSWRYRGFKYETTTMPGWAGSSWYFLRYMDPTNSHEPVSKEALAYWQAVDLYVGGSEHATGHLLYSRFWTHFLKDRGLLSFSEPFKRVLCQGMILGVSAIIYRDKATHEFVSADLKDGRDVQPLYVDISMVNDKNQVDIDALRTWRQTYTEGTFVCSKGVFLCDRLSEKMSKSKYNVVNPDDLIEVYGADTFRLHEMFLGPIDQTAIWSTQSIDGPHKFLQKVWRLFLDEEGAVIVDDLEPGDEELKAVHTAIAKVGRATEDMSYNTAIAALMICVNQLSVLQCHKRGVLELLLKLLHPYAPFITEELWSEALGHSRSILDCGYPVADESVLYEAQFECPVSINGKLRTRIMLQRGMTEEAVKAQVLEDATVQRWLSGGRLLKFIFVPDRIINIVCAANPD
ncbi:leucyl-tRNA synthetase [Pseudomonas protegens]|uniref:Leucine--tRNA ligase n=1 Tax=Pseudomonas sp. W17 TaxID=3144407 RepID=A0AAU7X0P6_9PSED|nr:MULTISPECIES: leucine--tRNA ligase [Pseudomonas]MBP5115032.1 leucine--tRNA ligase [Pseudomonas protegens]MCS4260406.1 leucyl-tRNA synthetase [Pseudomonas sp. BIGb0176]NAN52626.1 leucine--tRNA ligase [Pseudomonas protegens]NUE79032.1 leucine--tRNA ligase [Pseudomonas protegens]QTU20863.1 leucine--tRNA ligase [Pseudomonas protegens]